MFLFVLLSFAIVSEVSAVSDAEADGTGFDPIVKSVAITNHDFASERENMQNQDNDFDDEFKFHNEQNSFNNAPNNNGDNNIENEHLYEHDMNDKESDKDDFDFKGTDLDVMHKPLDNMSDMNPMGGPRDFNMSDMNPVDGANSSYPPKDLRDNNFPPVPNGEGRDEVVSNLSGLNKISPDVKDIKKDNMTDQKPMDNPDVNHPGIYQKNKSSVLPKNTKNNKNIKKVSKAKNKKVKSVKKPKAKKTKSVKKPKKMKKSLKKNSKKERAKL